MCIMKCYCTSQFNEEIKTNLEKCSCFCSTLRRKLPELCSIHIVTIFCFPRWDTIYCKYFISATDRAQHSMCYMLCYCFMRLNDVTNTFSQACVCFLFITARSNEFELYVFGVIQIRQSLNENYSSPTGYTPMELNSYQRSTTFWDVCLWVYSHPQVVICRVPEDSCLQTQTQTRVLIYTGNSTTYKIDTLLEENRSNYDKS